MKTLTREINATLLAMENSGAISPIDRCMARAQEAVLARFYGLPKVHKEGAPPPPIVSLKGTPTYGLAKWLFQRLNFLTSDSNTTVSKSSQFLEKHKGDLAIETIELLLQSKYDETENRLGHAQILQLLKLCYRTYFTFDGTTYEQVKGTPMGSPISGFIAEAVLQRLESLVFQHHRPKFWARYVDDTFVVIERDQVLTFQEHLNAVFPDIQFTMKEEENNQLAFLDVLVCRKDCGGLKTKVFRKATHTMQPLETSKYDRTPWNDPLLESWRLSSSPLLPDQLSGVVALSSTVLDPVNAGIFCRGSGPFGHTTWGLIVTSSQCATPTPSGAKSWSRWARCHDRKCRLKSFTEAGVTGSGIGPAASHMANYSARGSLSTKSVARIPVTALLSPLPPPAQEPTVTFAQRIPLTRLFMSVLSRQLVARDSLSFTFVLIFV
nr:unnamed protein product [Spirometra erinaceieuropaei]